MKINNIIIYYNDDDDVMASFNSCVGGSCWSSAEAWDESDCEDGGELYVR